MIRWVMVFTMLCMGVINAGSATQFQTVMIEKLSGDAMTKSDTWRDYKELFAEIKSLKSPKLVNSLYDRIHNLSPGLFNLFAGRKSVADRLVFILMNNLKNRSAILNPTRGKPTRPNWEKILKEDFKHLSYGLDLLESFQEFGMGDPWIYQVFKKDLKHYLGVVEADTEVLRDNVDALEIPCKIANFLREVEGGISRGKKLLLHEGRP